jgi:hypothetical protein
MPEERQYKGKHSVVHDLPVLDLEQLKPGELPAECGRRILIGGKSPPPDYSYGTKVRLEMTGLWSY